MRSFVLGLIFLTIVLISCGDDTTAPPQPEPVRLLFSTESLRQGPDSTAYLTVGEAGSIVITGFYQACSHSIEGRLVKVDEKSVVVDAEISQVQFICIVGLYTRYKAVLTGLSSGDNRVILEHVIRDRFSGELIRTETVLDSVVSIL